MMGVGDDGDDGVWLGFLDCLSDLGAYSRWRNGVNVDAEIALEKLEIPYH